MAFFNRKLRSEALEQRHLLSANPGITAAEGFDFYDLAVMYAPETVAAPLVTFVSDDRVSALRQIDTASLDMSASVYEIIDGSITVSVMGNSSSQDLLPVLATVGFTPTFVSPDYPTVDGTVPLSRLHELLAANAVTTVLPYMPDYFTNSVGSVSNDAEIALRGETIRNFLGLTGAGVTIGVISDGAGGVDDSQETNDLPPDLGTPGAAVTLDVMIAGTGNEGTAMLELVHDIASGSNLLFHAAGTSEDAFASAVNALVAAGANVIVDDINGLTTESWFADGAAAAAITDALDAGVFYASSAGNRGDNAFEADANFVANQNVFGNVGTFHDFDGNGDFLQAVTITQDVLPNVGPVLAADFQLQFDQLFNAVTSDVRLWFFDANGNFITSSTQNNIAAGDPNDYLSINGTGVAQLAIELVTGPAPQRLRWTHWGDVGAIEHDAVAGNLRTGRDPGHAATVGNVSVGATDVAQPLVRRGYSGIGEVTRTIDATGASLPNIQFRGGPTLMGVDGTATGVDDLDSGGNPVNEWNDFTTFFGTSAAAPNVAAIAALLLEANPSLTPETLRGVLTDSAIDFDVPGVDLTSGAGLVDGLGAIGLARNIEGLVGLDDDEYILVNDTRDLLDANTDPTIIDIDTSAGMPGEQVSLRSAVIEANNAANNLRVVLLPEDVYDLNRTGAGNNAGDLDITGDVTIVGAGAGLSVIDAGGTTGLNDRLFEVHSNGSLHAQSLTVTGGDTTSVGGGLRNNGGDLSLMSVAVVGNQSGGAGGGIHTTGDTTIIDSAIALNDAQNVGGGIYGNINSVIALGSTVLANNTSQINYHDLRVSGTIEDWGYNLIEFAEGTSPLIGGVGNLVLNTESVDFVVTDLRDRIETADDDYATSLREAVDQANANGGKVWIPAWELDLTLQGGNSLSGDLDITDEVTVEGVGPGYSVIDATDLADRVFEVNGTGRSLALSRLTVFNGDTISAGAAVLVVDAELDIDFTAMVDNDADSAGGAVRVIRSQASIHDSVFTNGSSITVSVGGAISASGVGSSLTIGDSVFAHNTANIFPNVGTTGDVIVNNEGGNLADNAAGGFLDDTIDDIIPDANPIVVTSVRDRYKVGVSSDDNALSLREAVHLANEQSGADELWLPAWDFVLTRDRGANLTDTEVSYGDLDIKNNLTIRGISGSLAQTSVT